MGTDISLFTEVKINGQWHCYSKPEVGRDYYLFNRMAGVRGSGFSEPPISEPKGMPEDISLITKLHLENEHGFDYGLSWLNGDEILRLEECVDFPERLWGYLFDNSWGGFAKGLDQYPKEIEDIRFVFWFND